MRASYCARATSIGSVCVAGTPVPLSSSAWICGSTGIVWRPGLLGRAGQGCAPLGGIVGRQKAVEHPARPLVAPDIILAVEHTDTVDEDTVHADRVAYRARAARRQVGDPARRRDADRGRIEQ